MCLPKQLERERTSRNPPSPMYEYLLVLLQHISEQQYPLTEWTIINYIQSCISRPRLKGLLTFPLVYSLFIHNSYDQNCVCLKSTISIFSVGVNLLTRHLQKTFKLHVCVPSIYSDGHRSHMPWIRRMMLHKIFLTSMAIGNHSLCQSFTSQKYHFDLRLNYLEFKIWF